MRCCLLVLLSSTVLLAQDQQPLLIQDDLVTAQPAPLHASDGYVPLTLWQNYLWSTREFIAPGPLFLVAAQAAIDHSFDNPSRWGEGTKGYSRRVASRLGRVAVMENMAFAIRALDHEDPRYFRSNRTGVWGRARYAASRTLIARNERGGTMPAYSLILADFATPFVTQMWRPEPINVGKEFRRGGVEIGIAAFSNLGKEFWPDIRKKFGR